MQRANKALENRLLSKVSSMYYDQKHTQQEIADRLHLSRPKISRLLKKARKAGIVQISVVSPKESFVSLERKLEEKYDIKEVLVVEADNPTPGKAIKRKIGSAAADYLHRTISKGEKVGVTWGTTLQAMIDALSPIEVEGTQVIQALGGVGRPEAKAHAADISRRLSQLLSSSLTLLPAPGIVGSRQAKEVLLADRQVTTALKLYKEIDTLYVGLGSIDTNPILDKEKQELPPGIYEEIINSTAVGDIALHFFDVEGNEVDSQLKDLVIGISIQEVQQVDTVVGIAGGVEKVNVIKGALNSHLIDVLITDEQVAQKLVKQL